MTRAQFETIAHGAFRIAAGAGFFTHGAQKLFGWFGSRGPVDYWSEFGVAGVLETLGGLAMMLGLFVQPVAFVLAGEMAVAYFWKHAARQHSIWWWQNRGEVVMLYSFIWLYFSARGAGAFSVDAWLKRRKPASPTG